MQAPVKVLRRKVSTVGKVEWIRPDLEWMSLQYLLPPDGLGKSTKEVAEELGCCRQTVETWVEELGLTQDRRTYHIIGGGESLISPILSTIGYGTMTKQELAELIFVSRSKTLLIGQCSEATDRCGDEYLIGEAQLAIRMAQVFMREWASHIDVDRQGRDRKPVHKSKEYAGATEVSGMADTDSL